jgi:branched-chain amino acid transport system substrate-binding protein
MRRFTLSLATLAGLTLAATTANAQITVGFVTSLSGKASSIGLNYEKGINAAYAYQSEVAGQKIKLIKLDDVSDVSQATQLARKLVEQEKVDIMIGTSSAPGATAMLTAANELKVPLIAISPVRLGIPKKGHPWGICVTQTPSLMVSVIANRMKRDGIKTAGFIGFNDSWGDLVYNGAKKAEASGGPKVTSNERYSRTDTTVTAQALKVLSTKPDGVYDGGSATQGALPLIELRKLGYKGGFFGTPSLLNRDFVRIGGKAVEGVQVSAGPVIVTSQLPASHFSKKIGTAFHEIFKKANGTEANDGFSGYSFDAWVLFLKAAETALKTAKPGTQEFREALMQAIYSNKDVAGVHAVYNFTPKSYYGVDDRSLVVVKLVKGNWIYQP